MKLISIIIPHFNSWDKLSKLLETIPNENEIEVIIVDDHSENAVRQIPILETKFPNFIIKKNDTSKKGAGAARNIGLSIATGKWLLFADADDLFTKNFFEIIYPYTATDFDLIYFTPTSFLDEKSEESTRHKLYEQYIKYFLNNDSQFNELKLRYYFEPPWSKLVRHEVIKKNKIRFEEIIVANDVLFSTKIGYYSRRITASTNVIYAIRQSKGSLTSVVNERRFKQRFGAWLNYVKFLKTNLSKEELALLNITAIPQLLTVARSKLGIKNIVYVIRKSKSENISLFDKRLLNPTFLVNSAKKYNRSISSFKETETEE